VAAPTSWNDPASGGTYTNASRSYRTYVNYAGGYWFALSQDATSGDMVLRYATDPRGAWSTATLPAPPPGATGAQGTNAYSGVQSDGASFGFIVSDSVAGVTEYRIIHATDPAGTWAATLFSTAATYSPSLGGGFRYADGNWIVTGRDASNNGLLSVSSTVDGTYAHYTSAATTGYGAGWEITGTHYDGSTWVSTAFPTGGGNASIRYSSSLTSGWATPSSLPTATYLVDPTPHANGYWSVIAGAGVSMWYTDTPSGTWTARTFGSFGFGRAVWSLAWAKNYWVAGGDTDVDTYRSAKVLYSAGGGAPDGTFTEAVGAMTPAGAGIATGIGNVDYANGFYVAANGRSGELRYCLLVDAAPRLLRQRQSPKRTPSRVSWGWV
jgi:hypothetical protein